MCYLRSGSNVVFADSEGFVYQLLENTKCRSHKLHSLDSAIAM